MSEFITSLTKANARIRELETKIGLAHTAPMEQVEEANDRVALLERYATERPQAKTSAHAFAEPRKAPAARDGSVFGLQRAIEANKRQQRGSAR